MTDTESIPLICIACQKALKRLHGPTHPEGAVCFQGGAPFGSRHDTDGHIIGLDYYEIFVCDDCWPVIRGRYAVGVKRGKPQRVTNTYFSPEQVDNAFAESKNKQKYIQISEMYDGEVGD